MIPIGIGLSIAAAAIPTLLYTWLVWLCDRYEREPWLLLIAAFLWGAIPAIVLSLVAELVLHVPLGVLRSDAARDLIAAGGIAPLVEEPVKAIALLGVFWFAHQEFDDVLDGIVYGALVGFGFAMTENFLYFVSVFLERGWAAWTSVVLLRSVIFGFNHAFFTSLVGIGLGIARMARSRWVQWGAPLLALAAAITFHAIHNLGTSLAGVHYITLGISLLADWGGLWVILAVIALSWRQERRWIWEYLADEGIPEEDRRAAISFWRRSRISLLARGAGMKHAVSDQGYYQLLANLAFRKHRLARAGDEPGLSEEIAQLRERIREVRGMEREAAR
ncbi:MAG: PrsW family intramembrane metalloprotease [Anaerolineae bacterium]|nr:PrsW family intramembrane metalloprotease [Anaerolineae bacterium]